MLHEARNCAAFACSIASLKDDNDLLSCFLDSRLIRRPSVAIVRSPNTCATTVFRSLSYA